MDEVSSKLTIFFEEPFWVGVYERISRGKMQICKITFGSEPKDYEVYDFILRKFFSFDFSTPAAQEKYHCAKPGPKRMQRQISRLLQTKGVGTKAMQALKAQHEQHKSEAVSRRRAEKEKNAEYVFQLRQKKKKEKHRGR
jgi:hypothetical protein